jgi:hypothetical protein
MAAKLQVANRPVMKSLEIWRGSGDIDLAGVFGEKLLWRMVNEVKEGFWKLNLMAVISTA